MPRNHREDGPGTWHHVMNRAIARRTLFEWGEDMDRFLGLVAEAVKEGWIEVHVYSLLNTHFHMLVRSPVGKLPDALRHIQLGYVRWFNRSRKRDGPLVRGRFRSKPVDSLAYRCLLVGYVDANATEARLARHAASFPFCSAYHYARPSGPDWLCRDWIETVVCQELGLRSYQPERYADVFTRGFQSAHADLVERWVQRAGSPSHSDDLITGSDAAVLAWMRRKAALADGTAPGMPVVAPQHVETAVESGARVHGAWIRRPNGKSTDAWRLVRVFLLRQLAGLRHGEVAHRLGRCEERTRCAYHAALQALAEDRVFAERTRQVAKRALELCYGGPGRGRSC